MYDYLLKTSENLALCIDFNECDEGTAECHSNATCSNTVGSYYDCTCVLGYSGDVFNCTSMLTNVFCHLPQMICETHRNKPV